MGEADVFVIAFAGSKTFSFGGSQRLKNSPVDCMNAPLDAPLSVVTMPGR